MTIRKTKRNNAVTALSILLFLAAFMGAAPHARAEEAASRQIPVEAHRPMYFIGLLDDGLHGTEAKFQLSFRTRLGTVRRLPGTRAANLPLYFGYTQKSFWEVSKKSMPFGQSSYNPEIFSVYTREAPEAATRYSLQFGAEHESNGMGGVDSRSWNRAYIQPSFERDINGEYTALLSIKAWRGFRVATENIDIRDYYGVYEVTAGVVRKGWLRFSATGRKGRKGDALQADLISNFHSKNPPFDFYLQYWRGEGENLISYDRHTTNWGLGVMLKR